MIKILIAEDDRNMNKIIGMYLKKEGFEIYTAYDGDEALEQLYNHKIDLVILDWMMPKQDGISVCKEMQKINHPAKIVMLTAKSEVEDEIMGLDCGVDDFIRKPFEPKILVLRVKKLVGTQQIIQCNDLVIDLKSNKLFKSGENIVLSKKELDLITHLMKNKNQIIRREQLIDRVWGMDYYGEERTVDTHIRRLRSKVGEDAIVTYRGLGYGMEDKGE